MEEPGSGGGLVASNSPSVAPLYVAEGRLAWPWRALLRRHKELAPEPEEPPSDCDGAEEERAAVDDDVVACDAVAAIAGTGGVPLSLSLSRSSLGDLAPHRLNHKLGLRSNSFDDRPSSLSLSRCTSLSLSTLFSFSFSFSFSAVSSLPLMNREGTGGTGGVSTAGLRGATIPSAVDGRILELPGEVRREWKRPECVRTGVVGEAVVESEVPGIRIAGSDFLRVGRGRASEGMRGGEAREGDEGAFSIGGRVGAGVTVGTGVGSCGSPNPGGSAGSEGSGTAPPLASGAGTPEPTSGTTGGGGLSPTEARSRSTA